VSGGCSASGPSLPNDGSETLLHSEENALHCSGWKGGGGHHSHRGPEERFVRGDARTPVGHAHPERQ